MKKIVLGITFIISLIFLFGCDFNMPLPGNIPTISINQDYTHINSAELADFDYKDVFIIKDAEGNVVQTEDYYITGVVLDDEGEYYLLCEYQGVEAYATIYVSTAVVPIITINADKLSILTTDVSSFNKTEVFNIVWSDGTSVTTLNEMITGTVGSSVGEYVLTVTYEGVSKSATIVVSEKSVTPPAGTTIVCTATDQATKGKVESYYSINLDVSYWAALSSTQAEATCKSATSKSRNITISYSGTQNYYKYTDKDVETGKVILFYTRALVDNVSMNGGYPHNREHVYCQSYGPFGTGDNVGKDLHHIRPTFNKTNGIRSSLRYGYAGANVAWSSYEGYKYAKVTSSLFEPLDCVKGDVARICFYVCAAYGYPLSRCVYGGDVSILIEWNELDPVDANEISRNNEVQKLQGNRNIFIDFPSLANYIWG